MARLRTNGVYSLCGGSLISSRWILTAAHCLENTSEVKVSLGALQLVKTPEYQGSAKRIITHENYTQFTKGFDIGLVELEDKVSFSQRISPVNLPSSSENISPGLQCWATGWGNIRENEVVLNPTLLASTPASPASGTGYRQSLGCSVCLDLLKDPVTLLCGHSYCMGCIKNCWDQEDQTGIYSCPQCRQTFTPRPDLYRNTILAEVVEKLKETGLSGPPPAHSPAGPGDVLCDVCTGRQRGAVKSCLVCLASYKQLGATKTETQQRLQEREKELQELRQAVDSLRVAVQDTDRIFTELIRSIERTRSEVTELIRDQERAAVSQAEGLLERLEKEIVELKRRDAELNQLSHTENHIHFLQNFQSVCVPPGAGDSPSIPVHPHFSLEAVRRVVSGLKERLEDLCKKESVKISTTAAVTLDLDTAHCGLSLSEDGKRVRLREEDTDDCDDGDKEEQSLSDNPHRFDLYTCVVSREAFTSGRHYWEVEVNDSWRIGVTRESAKRKGRFSISPQQGYWCLYSYSTVFSALTAPWTRLPLSLRPRKLGVCVDIEERKVSFYIVESRAHLYTFTDIVFTQGEKIYPVFWTWDSDKGLELLPAVSVEIKPVTDS
ncbi:TRI39 ligase, partial [Atractosteus spatula]|nr:TRI39 ligase [Atractosteus spatula]